MDQGAQLSHRGSGSSLEGSRVAAWLPAALFASITALVTIDVAGDLLVHTGSADMALDVAIMALSVPGLALMWRSLRRAEARARGLSMVLAAGAAPLGVGGRLDGAVERQLGRWRLAPAEREVMLLLLGGAMLDEVAAARGCSEPEVRRLAISGYRKIRQLERDGAADDEVRDLNRTAVYLLVRLRRLNRANLRSSGDGGAARDGRPRLAPAPPGAARPAAR